MTAIGHEFQESLARGEDARNDPYWEAFFRKYFENLYHIEKVHDIEEQRQGVDWRLWLTNGKVITIDAKARFKNYGDIALEYEHRYPSGQCKPGWMDKDLGIDYIAYGIMPTRTCYLWNWPLLRRSWLHYKEEWIHKGELETEGFRLIPAVNKDKSGKYIYTSWSVAVPMETLQRKIKVAKNVMFLVLF